MTSESTPRVEGTEPRLLYPDARVDGWQYGRTEQPTDVWVDLRKLYLRDPGAPRHPNGAGIEMAAEVPGRLTHRYPTFAGDWMALVSYEVPYADGRRNPLELRDQLIPYYALRRRDWQAPETLSEPSDGRAAASESRHGHVL